MKLRHLLFERKNVPENRPKRLILKKMTELVSRVLYACAQPSSIFTANYFTVQAKSSATIDNGTGSPSA